ncbi:hypothetical protein BG53_13010 [Paenibacillus darwinianus]|uniref:Uncharacterized protein n=1 Tax=Paenibacillus darwinianus TaxID=1380763 RepID=A0A9W5S1U7_9BACL|nr:hypothetical protein [Paenibacillus darwinianus]EXX89515.1 hypothetical protein CH50_01305 [Paenibacillus darwinianus]EXX90755.1 hypothetical protein BG53_13010 [Paenibacillus darwinianus]EXX90904.1 hypothetical protein BG52_11925 [Paenibacillus darwinianus]
MRGRNRHVPGAHGQHRLTGNRLTGNRLTLSRTLLQPVDPALKTVDLIVKPLHPAGKAYSFFVTH